MKSLACTKLYRRVKLSYCDPIFIAAEEILCFGRKKIAISLLQRAHGNGVVGSWDKFTCSGAKRRSVLDVPATTYQTSQNVFSM